MNGYEVLRFQVRDLSEVTTESGSYWTGRILLNGESYPIERRGGWTIEVGSEKRHLLPEIASEVQSLLPASARRKRLR